ncbi:DNA-binding protein [Stutzerimonas stutzeri]|uniref:DNA-binding protein n=1 Tax=Stutzerimonas stutzeri TaxID=316 RepID=UPI00210BAD96|nr:DNA-binding protein [Stutzerimonas stutzeri]MCQ4258852.1 DNA-binding protein [Stutzerimonas stutzeri]
MSIVEAEIRERLQQMNVVPLIGGLIPEQATAMLLGYSPEYMRRQASKGLSPLPYVQRANRRFYRIEDIERFATETV